MNATTNNSNVIKSQCEFVPEEAIASFEASFEESQRFFENFDLTEFCLDMRDELGLQNLRIGDWGCLEFFEEFRQLMSDRRYEVAFSAHALTLPCINRDFGESMMGRRVWVRHSLWNTNWGSCVVKGPLIADFLHAIDEALSNHLVGEELDGGRSCYLEDIVFGDEPGMDDGDVYICLGS